MKKIYIAAISLLALLLVTSCSNDEIDIEKVGRKYDLTFNVSTQDIFEKFDLTNSVRDNYLRDGSRAVGVYTFLYNQNGDLLQKDQIVLPTYNIATKTYSKLVEGKYTFVCVETLVNPDVDNTSEDWSIEGEDKLSTLKLKAEGVLGWASILGTSTQVVDLSRSTEISVTPEAVGARVNLYCYNFGNATYPHDDVDSELITNIGLATTDILEYYSLNPQLSRKERYSENLTESGKTIVRAQMTPERFEEGYFTYFYIVESEVTWRFSWQFASSNSWWNFSNRNITASIEDGKTYYAGMYYYNSEYVTDTYFGDRDGLTAWKTDCDEFLQSIASTTTELYAVPYINWSVGTVSAVKSYMNSFTLAEDVTLQDGGKYRMTYFDASNNAIYWYDFKTSTTGLTDSYVILSKENVTLDQVKSELQNEGYTLRTQGEDYTIYANSNSTTAVYLYELTSFVVVNYYDPSAYTSSAPSFAKKLQNKLSENDIPFVISNNNREQPLSFKSLIGKEMKANCNRIELNLMK